MEVWKIIFLSKWVICRFHANLPGCKIRSFLSDSAADRFVEAGKAPNFSIEVQSRGMIRPIFHQRTVSCSTLFPIISKWIILCSI